MTRGEGPALFADTEAVDVVTHSFGFGHNDLLLVETCDDWVEVPADVTIVSDEADIHLAMDATIRNPGELSQGTNPGADIDGSVPYEQSGLEVDGIDGSYDEQGIEFSVSMQPAEQSVGDLYWHGSTDNRERIVRILTWGQD